MKSDFFENIKFISEIRKHFFDGKEFVWPVSFIDLKGWPTVPVPEEERLSVSSKYYHEEETLYVEELEVIKITDREIHLYCSAPWQMKHLIILGMRENQLQVLYHDYIDSKNIQKALNHVAIMDGLKIKYKKKNQNDNKRQPNNTGT